MLAVAVIGIFPMPRTMMTGFLIASLAVPVVAFPTMVPDQVAFVNPTLLAVDFDAVPVSINLEDFGRIALVNGRNDLLVQCERGFFGKNFQNFWMFFLLLNVVLPVLVRIVFIMAFLTMMLGVGRYASKQSGYNYGKID